MDIELGFKGLLVPHLLYQFLVLGLVHTRIKSILQPLHYVQNLSIDSVINLVRLASHAHIHLSLLSVHVRELSVEVKDCFSRLDRLWSIVSALSAQTAHLLHSDLKSLRRYCSIPAIVVSIAATDLGEFQ